MKIGAVQLCVCVASRRGATIAIPTMQNLSGEGSMYRQFEEDFDKLRTRLIRMGSLVEEQVELAFRALLEGNATLAELVIERDDKVDKLDLKIDKQVQRIFALSQPVARDLRLLLAAIKINNEFERIGDYAVIVARLAFDSDAHMLAERVGFERITRATFTMVKASLDAFVGNDPELAKHVLATDDVVDALERELGSDHRADGGHSAPDQERDAIDHRTSQHRTHRRPRNEHRRERHLPCRSADRAPPAASGGRPAPRNR